MIFICFRLYFEVSAHFDHVVTPTIKINCPKVQIKHNLKYDVVCIGNSVYKGDFIIKALAKKYTKKIFMFSISQ